MCQGSLWPLCCPNGSTLRAIQITAKIDGATTFHRPLRQASSYLIALPVSNALAALRAVLDTLLRRSS